MIVWSLGVVGSRAWSVEDRLAAPIGAYRRPLGAAGFASATGGWEEGVAIPLVLLGFAFPSPVALNHGNQDVPQNGLVG